MIKYGSNSFSERFCDVGGKRKNCGPGVVCAAVDGKAELEGGDWGIPLADVPIFDFNLADADGTGSHA